MNEIDNDYLDSDYYSDTSFENITIVTMIQMNIQMININK